MPLRITKEEQESIQENYRVIGVHCATCKLTIEQALKGIKGIRKVTIDPVTRSLSIELEDPTVKEQVLEKIRSLGYDLETESIVYNVQGLKTVNPSKLVEDLLRSPGILSVTIDQTRETIKIEYSGLLTSQETIKRLLEEKGLKPEKLESTISGRGLEPIVPAGAGLAIYITGALLDNQPLMVISIIPSIYAAWRSFIRQALLGLRNLYLTTDTLFTLGVMGGLLASLVGYLTSTGTYIDAVIFITFFVVLGRTIESRLRRKAEEILEEGSRNIPRKARILLDDGSTKIVGVENLEPGAIVVVRAGETIPVDGLVDKGSGLVDESLLTGEPDPVRRREGDLVYAGTILVSGGIRVKTLRTGKYRLIERILREARQATLSKPRIQELADRVTGIFVPLILLVSSATLGFWLLKGKPLAEALLYTTAVLVVACPCALGIAVPAAISGFIGKAMRIGVLARNPDVVDNLARSKIWAFDKTGTLTVGKPRVAKVTLLGGLEPEETLWLAASLEQESNHPIARAIVDYYSEKYSRPLVRAEEAEEIPGYGITGVVAGRRVSVGKRDFVPETSVNPPVNTADCNVYIIIDDQPQACLKITDTIRKDAEKLVKYLKSKNKTLYIISGDSQQNVAEVADRLRIPRKNTYPNTDPFEKPEIISRLRTHGTTVFVGDGINDAAALAAADVGIAVSGASDIAKVSGDLVLLKDDLNLIIKIYELGIKTSRIVKENLAWAFLYNILLIPVAAGALSSLGIVLEPGLAALAMSLSSISVTLNSLRILR